VPLDAATIAWAWTIPFAAVAVVLIVLLGPPLGALLLPAHSPYTFVGTIPGGVHPEPTEQGRYLIAVGAPALAALALATLLPRLSTSLPTRAVDPLAVLPQLALVGVVIASIVAQYRFTFGFAYTRGLYTGGTFTMHYFSPATLAVGIALAVATASALRSEAVRRRATAALLAESRPRRFAITGCAAVATLVWLLHAVHSDAEIGNALEVVRYHLAFTLDETFAVINGRTPLVDFTAQYGSLWPFVLALPMVAFGKTVLAFTVAACTISGLAVLGVFGVLRRAVRSATAALLLYLPFLATSLFTINGTPRDRMSPGSYYAAFPLRYALPYFVAWLTARRIERTPSARGDWLLFTVAGLAMLNNTDFGIGAFGASIAAILWSGALHRRAVLHAVGWALAGIATALALVSLLTLARADSFPHLDRLVSYARIYAIGGFAQMPIPGVLGIHLLVYLTYVAAIVVATVRAVRRAENGVLTGMLAWTGVFGLGAGVYWVGRSHPGALVYEFSAWAFALALLTAVAIRALQPRHSAVGALVVLFGFGVMTCSLAQTPTPWEQVARLNAAFVPTEEEPDPNPLAASPRPSVRRFVSSLADGPSRFVVRRGAPVAILLDNGHRVADAYGVVDVVPYTGAESIKTSERIREIVGALRRAGGNTIVLPLPLDLSILPPLERMGFRALTNTGLRPYTPGTYKLIELPWPGGRSVIKYVDVRHLHAPALSERR